MEIEPNEFDPIWDEYGLNPCYIGMEIELM